MSSQASIVSNVMDRLDSLPISLDILDNDILQPLNDAKREMGILDIASVVEGSTTELYLEVRTEWYVLHRVKNSEVLDFKYSTGADGRSVDKTSIVKNIKIVMDDLDEQFQKGWSKSASSKASSTSQTWTRIQRTRTSLTNGDS